MPFWQRHRGGSLDPTTVIGIIVGIGGILFGNAIEGGQMSSLLQGASFLIILLGTLGAVLVSSGARDINLALRLVKKAFESESEKEAERLLKDILEYSRFVKRESLLALEEKVKTQPNVYLANSLRAVIDGIDPKLLESVFENQIEVQEQHLMGGAKVWTEAGGFAPTIGIIGAVLGLIQVMSNLTDTSKLASGIAVAFVATIYGVGVANLILLPLGNKIKKRIQQELKVQRMILEGALGIQAGLNPLLLEMKLRAFLSSTYEK